MDGLKWGFETKKFGFWNFFRIFCPQSGVANRQAQGAALCFDLVLTQQASSEYNMGCGQNQPILEPKELNNGQIYEEIRYSYLC